MIEELARVRARAAYWEKRIELETRQEYRRQQLAVFAWAELARLVVRQGVAAYGHSHPVFEKLVRQEFRLSIQGQRVEAATSEVFAGSPPTTASRRKKPKPRPARAAKDRR